jgi:hypothetical protein
MLTVHLVTAGRRCNGCSLPRKAHLLLMGLNVIYLAPAFTTYVILLGSRIFRWGIP